MFYLKHGCLFHYYLAQLELLDGVILFNGVKVIRPSNIIGHVKVIGV